MGQRRRVNLKTGHVYGLGSLTVRPRTVTALSERGTIVGYEVGDRPTTVLGALDTDRKPGRAYSCSRRQFLLWLDKVRREVEAVRADAEVSD